MNARSPAPTSEFAEVGAIIARDAEAIVGAWAGTVRDEHNNARESHWKTLRDQFPAYLRALGSQLKAFDLSQAPAFARITGRQSLGDASLDRAKAAGKETIRSRVLAIEHGFLRFKTGWTLDEVVTDYQTLRVALFHHLVSALERELSVSEVQAINYAVDEGVASAIVSFSEHQQTVMELANQRLVDFMGVLGHELRNPLSAISMAEQLLRRVPDAAGAENAAKIIRNNTGLMTRLVDDMLSISRITSGKIELVRGAIDIRDVAHRAVVMMSGSLAERQHELRTDFPDEVILIDGDADRLEQVFANLLTNAIRYTKPSGTITMSIEIVDTTLSGMSGGDVLIKIVDTGIGIAEEDQRRIFDLFQQSGDTDNEGLGIGLALVRVLVESHGGSIDVYSRGLGKGTEFSVVLPRLGLAKSHEVVKDSDEDLPGLEPTSFLVVDDRESLADTTASLLAQCGHQTHVAYNGIDAIGVASSENPAIILLDLAMPEMDGYQTLAKLRQIDSLSKTMIIATSGIVPSDLRRVDATQSNQFDAYLRKPVQLRDLFQQIASIYQQRSDQPNLLTNPRPSTTSTLE